MKRALLIAGMGLLAACGSPSSSSAAHSSSSPTASASPAQHLAAATAVESARAANSNSGAVYFLGGNQQVMASATFTLPKEPNVGNAAPIMPPDAVYAAGKIFFTDSTGLIRSLDRQGNIKKIVQFPLTSPQAFLSFWVNPGATQFAAIVIKVPDLQPCPADSPCAGGQGPGSGPLHTTIYFANAGGAPHLVASADVANNSYSAPRLVGWGSSGPLVATSAVGTQDGSPGIDFTYDSFNVLNSDGSLGNSVGGGDCKPLAVDSVGILCGPDAGASSLATTTFSYRDFSGTEIRSFTIPNGAGADGAVLSPSGDKLAYLPTSYGNPQPVVLSAGATQAFGGAGDLPLGWIDATHILVDVNNQQSTYKIIDLQNSSGSYVSSHKLNRVLGWAPAT